MNQVIKTFLLLGFFGLTLVNSGCKGEKEKETQMVISTSYGDITIALYNSTPKHRDNFIKLVQNGFYDDLLFHRVIDNFMIQGGCPNGNGTGGPGYTIQCETRGSKQIHDRGVMSMAHRGPNTGGSQFFICHNRSNTRHLDGVHTCFGKITAGVDLIDDITGGDVMEKVVLLN